MTSADAFEDAVEGSVYRGGTFADCKVMMINSNSAGAKYKYEQQIMNLMPMGIIGYIRLTNPSYFDPLYHNPFGIVMMTVVLVIYYLAYRMSEKILDGI